MQGISAAELPELFLVKLTVLSKGVQFGHNHAVSHFSKTDFTEHSVRYVGSYFNMVKTSHEDKNSSILNAFISYHWKKGQNFFFRNYNYKNCHLCLS